MIGIRASENHLTADLCGRISVQVETKDRLLHQALLDHVIERWCYTVNGDSGIRHAENTVKLRSDKRESGFAHRFGESLVSDVDAG